MRKEVEAKCVEIKKALQLNDASVSEIEKALVQSNGANAVLKMDELPMPEPANVHKRPLSPSVVEVNGKRVREEQKTLTVLSNDGGSPFELNQLLEHHKQNGDFLISWRELLAVLGMDDLSAEQPPVAKKPGKKTSVQEQLVESSQPVESLQPSESVQPTKEPVTVISVLGILTAIENLLGSLGPQLIQLLQSAVTMDKFEPESSNTLLFDDNKCILFETIKEKLRGLLTANLVDAQLIDVVRRVVDDMTEVVRQSNERKQRSCAQSLPLDCDIIQTLLQQPQINGGAEQPLLRPVQPVKPQQPPLQHVLPPSLVQNANQPLATSSTPLRGSQPQFVPSAHATLPQEPQNFVNAEPSPFQHVLPPAFLQPPPVAEPSSLHCPQPQLVAHQPQTYVDAEPSAFRCPQPLVTNTNATLAHHQPQSEQLSFHRPPSNPQQPPSNARPSLPSSADDFDVDANEDVCLKDAEIKVLMAKFSNLSEKDKSNFTMYWNQLKLTDPNRLNRLRNDVYQSDSAAAPRTGTLEWEDSLYCPGEVLYSGDGDSGKQTSIAYRVAKTNAGVKIRRRSCNQKPELRQN